VFFVLQESGNIYSHFTRQDGVDGSDESYSFSSVFSISRFSITPKPIEASIYITLTLLYGSKLSRGHSGADLNDIGDLVESQTVFADCESVSTAAIESENDLMLKCSKFYESARRAPSTGQLHESIVDRAVEQVLKLKLQLRLFG
jgi:hypothetical protein